MTESATAPLPAPSPTAPASSQSLYCQYRPGWTPAAPFIETPEGRRWTYADLDAVTAGLSRRLRGLGLARGDRLFCCVDRSPWAVFLYLACLRAGVAFVPFGPRAKEAEFAPVLADLDPQAIVCAPQLAGLLGRLAPGVRLLTLNEAGEGSLAALPEADLAPDAHVRPEDPAAIMFTSGTTGRPKGAVMPHGLFVFKGRALAQALGWSQADRLLHVMPLYHAHGLFMTLHALLAAGACAVLAGRFDAAEAVRLLPRATVFSGVPTMYGRMLAVPGLRECSRAMRLFVSASAALPPDVFHRFKAATGHEIAEGWGMSETTSNTMNPLHGVRKPGSAGLPLPGIDIRVLGPDDRELGRNETGVLALRLPMHFLGYWRRPAEDQPRYVRGLQVTGDLGWFDDDGYLHVAGRTSDVIITGGYNVYPREVEQALEQVDGVEKAAVFGLPHPDYGEAVAAEVVLRPGGAGDAQSIAGELKARLAGYKVPKALFVVDAFPLTELGKVQRGALAQRHAGHFLGSER